VLSSSLAPTVFADLLWDAIDDNSLAISGPVATIAAIALAFAHSGLSIGAF
jgi:hypothetical protein